MQSLIPFPGEETRFGGVSDCSIVGILMVEADSREMTKVKVRVEMSCRDYGESGLRSGLREENECELQS